MKPDRTVLELEGAIEAILFANGEAVSIDRLSAAIGADRTTTTTAARRLANRYVRDMRGLCITEADETFRIGTNPVYYPDVARLRSAQPRKLSPATIETLAIIAYKQPISKPQIEEIRGVDAHYAVNKLLEANLIKELGRSDAVGKPILLGTTENFLRYYGLANVTELPDMTNNTEEVTT